MTSPTILYCVGAPKAGTSWLYRTLHDHPGCHLRAVKEVHYWDTFDAEQRDRQLAAFAARLDEYAALRETAHAAGRGWQVANAERRLRDMAALIAVIGGARDGDTGYAGWLSEGAEGRLVADMTPGYALLPPETLARMARLSPRALFVYLVRDPLARLWSHVRMQAQRQLRDGQTFPEKANSTLWRILNKGQETHIVARGDYAAAVARLRGALPEGRLRVAYCEDLFTETGLRDMCGFLGIAYQPADGTLRAHEGPKAEMRPDLVDDALRFLRAQYEWAAREMGPLPANWQHNMARACA